ncbi:valyl-tRNA synthetase [Spiroplasma sabaudiense Ar-1343]|uniref:Valine--tRNA ligase n=1 Tax=Spiroplasma sabaudiense Ar-1343 TaxID=1276257 RepID=W6AAK2_9MOLU|nr:valine--tRNA ligase [Spiroplasma sabaudiense]AHI53880.1 valyl-tRNA synthetase [Spiroplasma sabaudiense Ar-1343]
MTKKLSEKYFAKEVEANKNEFWIANKYFEANLESTAPSYSIVMPPPNVTGKLHLGHAWDGSIQDFLIRYKKLHGFNTLWIPGMDHAGIATQAKVEARLKEQGLNRYSLGREKFINQVWEWKEEYASIIREQWGKLGLGLAYNSEKFTYSQDLNKLVNLAFVKMYEQGLIYRGKRIINWDPQLKTALSNIEVIYKEVAGKMYYFKYQIFSSNEYLVVATTRPETMFADQAVIVNPNDKRYQKFINKQVINPANGDLIPVISDNYVEVDFGTGAMKCTPAHDPNDFELGLRHNLKMPLCMNTDGTINQLGNEFNGLDRFEARIQLVEKIKSAGNLVKIEEITHQVGFSERSDVIVEPYLSNQWFVKMKPLAESVLKLQKSDSSISFFPKRFDKTLENWMTDTLDWTISRQIWWGHQIPAWYHKKTKETYVGLNPPEDFENWIQDEDVLDTWFSSALWPFAAMEWNPNNASELFQKFFPVSTLVTGYDIIFFWVARMIFQTNNLLQKKPFEDVLIHGLIRDENGKKMSKSLGNGIDPMDVIDEFGADSLRFFLLTNSSPGADLRFSTEKIRSSWNFINKIWNASRFVLLNVNLDKNDDEIIKKVDENSFFENNLNKWILNELYENEKKVDLHIQNYDFNLAGKEIYNFVWNTYCSWYIELAKTNLTSKDLQICELTQATLIYVLKKILIMLHPFIPFVTEEIYQTLNYKRSILEESWNQIKVNYENNYLNQVIEIIEVIRDFRAKNNLKKTQQIQFNINNFSSKNYEKLFKDNQNDINKILLKNVNSEISFSSSKNKKTVLALNNFSIEVDNDTFINSEVAIELLTIQLEEINKEILRSVKILNNENFLNKASKEKIDEEKNKYENYLKKMHTIKKEIDNH